MKEFKPTENKDIAIATGLIGLPLLYALYKEFVKSNPKTNLTFDVFLDLIKDKQSLPGLKKTNPHLAEFIKFHLKKLKPFYKEHRIKALLYKIKSLTLSNLQIEKIINTVSFPEAKLSKKLLQKAWQENDEALLKYLYHKNFDKSIPITTEITKKFPIFGKYNSTNHKMINKYIRWESFKKDLQLALKNKSFKSKSFRQAAILHKYSGQTTGGINAMSKGTAKDLIRLADQHMNLATNHFRKLKILSGTRKISRFRKTNIILKNIKPIKALKKIGPVAKFFGTNFGMIILDVLATDPGIMEGLKIPKGLTEKEELKFMYGQDMTLQLYDKMRNTQQGRNELDLRQTHREFEEATKRLSTFPHPALSGFPKYTTDKTIDTTSTNYLKPIGEIDFITAISDKTKPPSQQKIYTKEQKRKNNIADSSVYVLYNDLIELVNIAYKLVNPDSEIRNPTEDGRTSAYNIKDYLHNKIFNSGLTNTQRFNLLISEIKKANQIIKKIKNKEIEKKSIVKEFKDNKIKETIEKTDEWNEKKAKESELNTLLLKKKQLTLQLLKSKLILQLLIKQKKLRAIQNG